uniref:nucleolar and spindle-associated protein 1 isoform X2 n=1 Tax=Jaculus jaculus TaxID=51337 RepID=UPI001E1B4535|nr:nucleolar and spindle-associated protein 1 isoform X2 [Jaculus jaculus]
MSPGLQDAMTVPSEEELESFKYSDLQNLAKSLGLRANLRADKLLKALKAHLKPEANKNSNLDENQTCAFSCEVTEMQVSSQEQAEREPVGQVVKARRSRKTVHRNPKTQPNGSVQAEEKTQEKQKEVPSLSDQSQEDEKAFSSGKSEINGNEDSKASSEKRSLSMDGFSSFGNNKKAAATATTPNFKRLHEAHFKKMESIDEYVMRKKKHLKEHNSLTELKKPPGKKEGAVTPVPPRRRPSVACTPVSQCRSHRQPHGPASPRTVCGRGSVRHSALSATRMNVRFSAATKDNEHKRSLTKTPARKSPHVIISGSASKGQAVLRTPKLRTKENSSGKLKPWGQSKESNSLNEHGSRVNFHKKTYKQPSLQSREEQRKKHEQERKEKKEKILQARRGLIMPHVQ